MLLQKQQSRLDGLLALLEAKDTSTSVRRLAAQQLAELVDAQPSDAAFIIDPGSVHVLNQLLRVVLHSKVWDARICAGSALKLVVQRLQTCLQAPANLDNDEALNNLLTLRQLDPKFLMDTGSVFSSSSGVEYMVAAGDVREQWVELRRELLGGVAATAIDLDIGVSLADIAERKQNTEQATPKNALRVPQRRKTAPLQSNVCKRPRAPTSLKADVLDSVHTDSPEHMNDGDDDDGDKDVDRPSRKTSVQAGSIELETENDLGTVTLDAALHRLVCILADSLLSPDWETRHGAAVATRDMLSVRAFREWLPMEEREDIASRMYVLLAMDRFRDYASDQVVAPVPETVSMALGSVAVGLDAETAAQLESHLLELIRYKEEWQARHGGLLGMRYLLAVRADLRAKRLPETLPVLLDVLKSDDDDVIAAACEVIILIAEEIHRLDIERSANHLTEILGACWDNLGSFDELSACVTALVRCIEALLRARPSSCSILGEGPARVFRLLRHRNGETRRAALSCLMQGLRALPEASPVRRTLDEAGLYSAIWAAWLLETGTDAGIGGKLREFWYLLCDTRCTFVENDRETPQEQVPDASQHAGVIIQPAPGTPAAVPRKSLLDNVDGTKPVEALLGCSRHPLEVLLLRAAAEARSPVEAQKLLERLFQRMHWSLPGTAVAPVSSGHDAGYEMQLQSAEALACYIRMHPHCLEGERHDLASWLATLAAASSLTQRRFLALTGRALETCPAWLLTAVEAQLALLERSTDTLHEEAHAELDPLFWQTIRSLRQVQPAQVPALAPEQTPRTADLGALFGACTRDDLWEQVTDPEAAARLTAMRLNVRSAILRCCKTENTGRLLVAAAAVGALVRHLPELPSRVTPWIRILLGVLLEQLPDGFGVPLFDAHDACSLVECAQEVAAMDLARLTQRMKRGSKARDQVVKNLITARCSRALAALARVYGPGLFTELPQMEQEVFGSVESVLPNAPASADTDETKAEQHQRCDLVLCAVAEDLDPTLVSRLLMLFPALIRRRARALVPLCRRFTRPAMEAVIQHLLPLLEPGEEAPLPAVPVNRHANTTCDTYEARFQAIALLAEIVHSLGERIIPYAAFLVVPLLGRLVDQDERVRSLAAMVFGELVRLLPLEGALPADELLSPALQQQLSSARDFIAQLLGQKPLEVFRLSIPIGDNVQLRTYQQEGLNWLAFLHRYGLHGALCDDMGLGKTLMTLCILAADRCGLVGGPAGARLSSRSSASGHRDGVDAPAQNDGQVALEASAATTPLPSLVVCPASVMHHWHDEVLRFFPGHLTPVLVYAGAPGQRQELAQQLRGAERPPLVITSYEVVRSDLEKLASLRYAYVVLDEGHMIKNARSKLSQAVRRLHARHRLILTGTPIQNNVTELWALFDFLMPGYLGTEQSFVAQYAKPIQAARHPKCSDAAREAGERALAALHRQVLPFILRRMKENVMKELPPKVIQDRICALSDIQRFIYDSFVQTAPLEWLAETRAPTLAAAAAEVEAAPRDTDEDAGQVPALTPKRLSGSSHVFYALMFLRRLCTHPRLILSELAPELRRQVEEQLNRAQLDWNSLDIAPKMLALGELLYECGIASDDTSSAGASIIDATVQTLDTTSQRAEKKHRALIFAQLKETLDIIETDVLQRWYPQVSYLRLDGSIVDPRIRQDLVHRFNRDPTIDCLLLTTHVGGLGLNLTGADTVIFVECDYNPTVDLQAMDRAHRIGQTRVVTVHRLITRGTIEEKIMSIQRFKMHLATSVVNQENASLRLMNTEQILELFRPVAATGTAGALDAEAEIPLPSAETGSARRRAPGKDAHGEAGGRSTGAWRMLARIPEQAAAEAYGEEFQRARAFVQELLTSDQEGSALVQMEHDSKR
jgi:SNF2 family DNA or RNA helicase